ncbi:uncharacterized protein LOC128649975 [Bombina bombina]|uniref:uncharacterized protein LOC128649975 n=1 Tax=Bombina bombina TaxID=8345 RepID=UPI00235A8220|nr:uncharacterized protein LOC128649975 [Bombina bombina]
MPCGDLSQSKWWFLLAVLMYQVEMNWSQLTVISQPLYPTEGQNVLLRVSFSSEIYNINWYRGSNTFYSMNILTYSPGSDVTHGPNYTGRETVLDDGSLHIRDLLTNYSGVYTLELTTPDYILKRNVDLTVSPASGNRNNMLSTAVPTTQLINSKTLTPRSIVLFRTKSFNEFTTTYITASEKNNIVVGITVGSVVAISLFITGLVIYLKKYKRKGCVEQVYQDVYLADTVNEITPYSEYKPTDQRSLPSIPLPNTYPTYQNTNSEEENHYMGLTKYSEAAYMDLQPRNN